MENSIIYYLFGGDQRNIHMVNNIFLDFSQVQNFAQTDHFEMITMCHCCCFVLFVCVCIFFFILTSLLYLEVPQAALLRPPAPSVHPPKETVLPSRISTFPHLLQNHIFPGINNLWCYSGQLLAKG